jgi:hypothetical protein
LFSLLVGCGGSSQPVIWEVSRAEVAKPAACFPGGMLPSMQTTTQGIETSVGPWEIYDGTDNAAYLLLADKTTVFDGTKTDSYTFKATTTTTTTTDPPLSTTTTDTTADTIIFKLSGDTLTGTWETRTASTCTGDSCPDQVAACDFTSPIKGSRLAVSRYRVY